IVFNYNNYSDQYWLVGHTGSVNDISWDVQNTLISGASDPNAKVWSTAAKAETANLGMHRNSVYAVDRIASGTRIATGGGNSLEKGRSESQIYCAVSTDGGMNFDELVVVSEILSGMKHSPKVAMDGNDVISVVWYDDRNYLDDVYFSNSTDMGVSFSDDIPVSVTAGKVENLPTIAVERDTGTVHLAWQKETGGDSNNPIHDVHYANSSDNFGQITIIDANTSVQQTPDICAIPDGSQVFVTWVDARLGGYQIFLYNSSDGGMTFSGYDVVNDEDTQSKFSPAVGVNKYGNMSVVWHDYRDVGVNIYHSGNVLADTTAPIIISVTPEDGATNVSIIGSIMIEFSEPMDQASVEAAFYVTDGTTTYYASDCLVQWNNYGDTVDFTLLQSLSSSTLQQVTIGNTANDISGNDMASAYIFSFTTEADTTLPISSVDTISPYWQIGVLLITATASDTGGSGLANITLWYSFSSNNLIKGPWTFFESDVMAPWSWDFSFPDGDGYYEFYSTATDMESNAEAPPLNADASCAYDPTDPEANAGQDQEVTEGSILFFDGSDSSDNIGILSYSWTFNDGVQNIIIYGINRSHSFSIAGNYTITLTVTDAAGNTDTDTMLVTVEEPPLDTDGDGIPDIDDIDDDNDGFLDEWEECLGTNSTDENDAPLDTDGDGKPDGDTNNTESWMDTDDDGDGVLDADDPDPLDPNITNNGGNNTWLYIMIILVIAGIVGAVFVMKSKGKKPEPEESEDIDN
ncbi:MAG: Ig-like domain-containing protein, partial [Thermoplasmata archaeon]|nr:Ig-like domain-containing protein [Thermoplasmata archaeon]